MEKLDAELPNFLNLDFEFGCSEPDILLEVDAELPNFLNLDFSFGFFELLHTKKKKNVAEIDIDLGASEPGPPVKTR